MAISFLSISGKRRRRRRRRRRSPSSSLRYYSPQNGSWIWHW